MALFSAIIGHFAAAKIGFQPQASTKNEVGMATRAASSDSDHGEDPIQGASGLHTSVQYDFNALDLAFRADSDRTVIEKQAKL